ncbi:hypothetical protein DMENIID0001_148060 [Sergentomyia squamirostris]
MSGYQDDALNDLIQRMGNMSCHTHIVVDAVKIFTEILEKLKNAGSMKAFLNTLRANMQDLGSDVFKKIVHEGCGGQIPEQNAKVTYFCAGLSFSTDITDTSMFAFNPADPAFLEAFHGNTSFITGVKHGLLPGIYQCLMTMKAQEFALFVIPSKIMYGELRNLALANDELLLVHVINVEIEPLCQDAEDSKMEA